MSLNKMVVAVLLALAVVGILVFQLGHLLTIPGHDFFLVVSRPNIIFHDPDVGNIFFLETNPDKKSFSAIELCAFESASSHNAARRVSVLIAKGSGMSTRPPDHLEHLDRLDFVLTDFDRLFSDTPVEALWNSGRVKASQFHSTHTSDLLRKVVLLKYGGIYFDTDVISLAPVPPGVDNFVVALDKDNLNGAVLKFERGHQFLNDCLASIATDYQPDQWAHNGPYLLNRMAAVYCPEANWTERRQCDGDLTILPKETAYVVAWHDWRAFFEPARCEELTAKLAGSFAAHYYNHMLQSHSRVTNVSRNHALYRLAEENCPLTEAALLRPSIGKGYF